MRKMIAALLVAGTLMTAAQAAPPQPKQTAAQAQAAALKKEAGNVQGKPTLVNNKGTWEYVVMIQTKTGKKEVHVDANSGKINSDTAAK